MLQQQQQQQQHRLLVGCCLWICDWKVDENKIIHTHTKEQQHNNNANIYC